MTAQIAAQAGDFFLQIAGLVALIGGLIVAVYLIESLVEALLKPKIE